jgi:hypothetical protein
VQKEAERAESSVNFGMLEMLKLAKQLKIKGERYRAFVINRVGINHIYR